MLNELINMIEVLDKEKEELFKEKEELESSYPDTKAMNLLIIKQRFLLAKQNTLIEMIKEELNEDCAKVAIKS